MHIKITPQHQALLDSAIRDVIELYGWRYLDEYKPIPCDLRKLVIQYYVAEGGESANDTIVAEGARNIWADAKDLFRAVLIKSIDDSDKRDYLQVEAYPPLKPLTTYSVTQSGAQTVITCDALGLSGTDTTLDRAVTALYYTIRNQYFDDDYRPELDARNWLKQPSRTNTQPRLTEDQLARLDASQAAGDPVPTDIRELVNAHHPLDGTETEGEIAEAARCLGFTIHDLFRETLARQGMDPNIVFDED